MHCRQSVQDVFFDYTAGREGFTPFMYCDTLNLVTTGVGNLIDAGPNNNPGGNSASVVRARLNNVVSAGAMQPAMSLPWKLKAAGWTSRNPVAGELVSPAEVADAWTKVKRQNQLSPDFSQKGGFAYAGLTNLTLDMDGLKQLFNRTLTSFDASIAKQYSTYEEWPADAQLAILSMSWAMGPSFHPTFGFQKFFNAAVVQDFITAAAESVFKGGGSLTDPKSRNAAHQVMFKAADAVVKGGGDRDHLFFPGTSGAVAPAGPEPVVPAAPGGAGPGIASKLFIPKVGIGVAGIAATAVGGVFAFEWWNGRQQPKKGKR